MDATQAAEPIARPHKKPNLFRVAVATVIGTAVEAFDFSPTAPPPHWYSTRSSSRSSIR